MRLSEFILSNLEKILEEWESFAGTVLPESNFEKLVLRDSAEEILTAIAKDMETAQTASEQTAKSRGRGRRPKENTAAEIHAFDRLALGFNQAQVVSEYRALRATVMRLWIASSPDWDHSSIDQLIRFNEGIDQALSESTARFVEEVEKSRTLAIAIMAHDLRNPLNAMVSSAQMIHRAETLDKTFIDDLATMIFHSGMRMSKLIENLLDFTRTRFGQPLMVKRESRDLVPICQQTVAELAAAYPERAIRLNCGTGLHVALDGNRISQMLGNLIANAIHHGDRTSPVTVNAHGDPREIVLTLHNRGAPIPPSELHTIFDPFSRLGEKDTPTSHLGLGLFVAREIVKAHSGKIGVTSTAQDGTTVVVRLPRYTTA